MALLTMAVAVDGSSSRSEVRGCAMVRHSECDLWRGTFTTAARPLGCARACSANLGTSRTAVVGVDGERRSNSYCCFVSRRE